MSKASDPADKRYIAFDTDLIKQVRFVAAGLGVSVREYASSALREAVKKELPVVLAQMTASAK